MGNEEFKILVVEDNYLSRKIILQKLRKNNYQVAEAENGFIALDQVTNWKPDLVLLDVMMPELDGYEVLKILREKMSQVELPIILVTAIQDSRDVVKGFQLGANDYLPKNFNTEELFARVNTALQIRKYHKLLQERNTIMERDLDIARLIQKKLLPVEPPKIPNYQISSLYVSMDKVGGDYFDYNLTENYCDFFIADVSGHGVPGAFVASILKMSIQYTHLFNYNPTEILLVMDRAVSERGVIGMFATAIIMRLFPETGKIVYSNAGHPPIIIHRRKSDAFIELSTPGAPLGINFDFKKQGFFQEEFLLEIGDRIILFTDGILESFNEENVPFETNGWNEFLIQNKNSSLELLSTNLIQTLKNYSKRDSFEDDLTWVVIDYTGI